MNQTNQSQPSASKAKWILISVMLVFVSINVYYGFALLYNKDAKSPASTPSSQTLTKAVPDFRFTNQEGVAFGREDLLGKTWVAAFVFTRCPGPCPMITANLAKLNQYYKDQPDIMMVSFSIDPEYDTPEVLRKYAARHDADLSRWTFLTGEKSLIHDLSMNGFYSAVVETAPEEQAEVGPFIHGTRIYVVDQTGQIVAAFDGTTPAGIEQTKEKIAELIPQ